MLGTISGALARSLISYKTARVVGLTPSLKSQGRGLRNPRKSAV